jgi:hypothetical protein
MPQLSLVPEEPTQTAQDILAAFVEDASSDGINRVAERETALQALAYVLCRNFKAAEATENEGVFSIGFKVAFNRNEIPTSVTATARCSKISKAEIDLTCPQDED